MPDMLQIPSTRVVLPWSDRDTGMWCRVCVCVSCHTTGRLTNARKGGFVRYHFRITVHKPRKNYKHGFVTPYCPFHLKSTGSRCTKAVRIEGGTPADRDRAVRTAMAWCVGTFHPVRQWSHVNYYPAPEEVLDHGLLDAKAAMMLDPPDVVLRDDQRDALDEKEQL